MTKKQGNVYAQLSEWSNIKTSEIKATKRKNPKKNYGVKMHSEHWMADLVEIQQGIINRTIHTGEYEHEQRISGQDKVRDIAKLKFHPSHIYHQDIVEVSEPRIEKALISTTYASRTGMGQIKAALQLEEWIKKDPEGTKWVGQGDVVKYYAHIPHSLLRRNIGHLFKDKEFINAYMEPFEKFSSTGIGIPLGIRPSQSAGNIALMTLDRFVKETLHVKYYLRYLDDFVIFGKTKGEVKRNMKRIEAFIQGLGFQLHPPKIKPLQEGLDMLGFVYYDKKHLMYWRKADKVRYAKHRARLTNPKRIRELDCSAWGMLKWGNSNAKRYHKKMTGIDFAKTGIKLKERTDKNGVPFIEGTPIGMQMVLGRKIIVKRWVRGIHTAHGDGRDSLLIELLGKEYKLIVNAAPIKDFIGDMERNHVTKFKTVFIEKSPKHYDLDLAQTIILEVEGRAVETTTDGRIIYTDTQEEVKFS